MILNRVLETIDKHNMISYGDKIVVGLSGGPDSVCLVHLLSRLRGSRGIEVYAAHLNHQIRGIEAHKDALYVSKLCKSLDIPLFMKSEDVPTYCREKGLSLEEGARKIRYDMFFEIKEKTGANSIAIGHNMNDQAETVLMRMMRGTGLKGLRGIEYKRENGIIRPILDISRKDIEAYCRQHGFEPKIDKTNLESIYTRNRIRLELLPYMEEHFNSNVTESVVRMSNSLKCDGDYIDSEAQKAYESVSINKKDGIEISVNEISKYHEAIKTRVIRYAIRDVLGDISFVDMKHIEEVLELEDDSKKGKMLNLPRGLYVYRNEGCYLFTMNKITYEDVEYSYNLPKNGFVKIKELDSVVETDIISIDKYKSLKHDENTKYIDFNKIIGGITVRNRQPGDKIKLKSGTKKIKQLFIDLKIPKEYRSRVPIIADDEGILLAGNYRMSERCKIDDDTKEILRISVKKL